MAEDPATTRYRPPVLLYVLLSLCFVTVAPVLVLGHLSADQGIARSVRQVDGALRRDADRAAVILRRASEANLDGLRLLAATFAHLEDWSEEPVRTLLERQLAATDRFDLVYLAGADGVSLAIAPRELPDGGLTRAGVDYSDRDYFRAMAITLQPAFSRVQLGRQSRIPNTHIAVPIVETPEGGGARRLRGFVLGAVSLDRLMRALRSTLQRSDSSRTVVLDAHGVVMLDSEARRQPLELASRGILGEGGCPSTVRVGVDEDGVAVRGACAPVAIGDERWQAWVLVPEARVAAAGQEARQAAWLAGSVAFMVACALAVVVTLVSGRILGRVQEAAGRIAEGDLGLRPRRASVFASREEVELRDAAARTLSKLDRARREQERLVEALRETQRELQPMATAFMSASDAIEVLSPEGRVQLVNDAYCRTLGVAREDAVGRPSRIFDASRDVPIGDSMPDDMLPVVVGGHRVWRGEVRARVGDAELLLSVSAAPVRDDAGEVVLVVVLRRDVTSLHTMMGERAEQQRLESLGGLAAGFAHEFNNPLACVQANLALAREGLHRRTEGAAGASMDGLLSDAASAADRLGRLAGDLALLARPPRADRDDTPAAEVRRCLEQAVRLAGARLRDVALAEIDASPAVTARIEPARLLQIVLNLVANAAQAMPQGERHLRRVRISCAPDPEARASLLLRVVDNGSGMSPAVQRRIFEPFFTTKAPGEGTGLGLSIVRTLVREVGGEVSCTSTVGEGTSFLLRLPRGPDAEADAPAVGVWPDRGADARVESRVPEGLDGAGRAAASGQLLVVDDDPLVARSLQRMLRGYDVQLASSGEQALELLESGGEYGCVVTDLVMPGISGVDLFERVRRRWPGLADRVVFVTGGDRTMALRSEAERTGRPVIQKPLSAKELREAVLEVHRVG